ncbi:MAG: hypothetical protein R6W71_11875 [Bacteroidales bacterium]
MINTIFKTCLLLVILMSALSLRGEVIVGVSDPFQFGSVGVDIPLSYLAFLVSAGLIGLYTAIRHKRFKKNGIE